MTATNAVETEFKLASGNTGALRRGMTLVVAALFAVTVAGCGSSNLLGPSDSPSVASLPPAAAAAPPAPVAQSRIALAPVMGAPDAVGKSMGQELTSALGRQRISVVPTGEKPDYTLRGYIVATKERASTKVSYIFDLTDGAGKRVNRIQGEEMAQGSGNDPWAAVTPDMAQRISDKAATALASALSSLTPSSAAGSAPVGVGAAGVAAGVPAAGGIQTASIDRSSPVPESTTALLATVSTVSGAPGDGNTSLPAAMRQELQQAGFSSPADGQKAYGVGGKVTVGAIKDGKQPIKIEWRVTDPNGAHLATVAQNNEIQAGALDGAWGAVSSDAAQGASAKIKAIIEENRASGGARARQASRTKG